MLLLLLLLLQCIAAPVFAGSTLAQEPAQSLSEDAEQTEEEASESVETKMIIEGPAYHVAAKAALLIDRSSGKVIYEQNADERLYPASLTKIMTCLVALEKGNLSDIVEVHESAFYDISDDSSQAGLMVGERMTLENLLYCMMIVSGNEACNVIAEHIAGSVQAFVRMMNERAYELGCRDTHFSNPHGLHDDNHYTTARDLAIITEAALKSQNFCQIVELYEYTLPETNLSPERKLKTTNMLIYKSSSNPLYYSRAHGIKTGYTSRAGRCIISEGISGEMDLLAVVMGANTSIQDNGDLLMESFTECRALFDYGFDNFNYVPILSPLYPVAQVTVSNSAGAEVVAVAPAEEIKLLLPIDYEEEAIETVIELTDETVEAPVKAGDRLGVVRVVYQGDVLEQTELLAIADVAKSELSSAASGTGAYIQKNWWKWVVIFIVLVLAALFGWYVWSQVKRRAMRRRQMEKRRQLLEERRRAYHDEY